METVAAVCRRSLQEKQSARGLVESDVDAGSLVPAGGQATVAACRNPSKQLPAFLTECVAFAEVPAGGSFNAAACRRF